MWLVMCVKGEVLKFTWAKIKSMYLLNKTVAVSDINKRFKSE